MISAAEWPPRDPVDTGPWPRRRTPESDDSRDTWYSARLDRHFVYDSRCELNVIQLLASSDLVNDIQEQPLALGYTVAGRHRTYYPDLIVTLNDGRILLIEVKPVSYMPLTENQAKYTVARAVCRRNGWGFLVTDGRRHLQDLAKHRVVPQVEEALTGAIARHPLTWRDVLNLRQKHDITYRDLCALILRDRWEFGLAPFRIAKAGS